MSGCSGRRGEFADQHLGRLCDYGFEMMADIGLNDFVF